MLILTFEDSEEEILNHIISCVNTGARAFQVIENAKTNLSYGDIVILLDKRELFRKQEKIDLSFIEFEILHLLMRSPGRVFSKEQIYDIIWNEPYSGDYNVVMRHICNIREKIEDDPGHYSKKTRKRKCGSFLYNKYADCCRKCRIYQRCGIFT